MDRLTTDTWGAPEVLPRDPGNGLEDTTAEKYSYWDGQIIEGPDGRFHLFASRWNQEWGHGGWMGSLAVHAIADHPIGPYVDQGLIWPDYNNGVGHNVTALKLHDGRYAAIISDTRPGEVFIADSLDGPWSYHGNIEVDNPDGYDVGRMVNLSVILRPDGDYMIVPRSGVVLISKNGILGPYRAMGPSIYPTVEGLPLRDLEDPVLWYSGGLYHVVVNGWSDRKAWHITSEDGITRWSCAASPMTRAKTSSAMRTGP